LIVEQVKDQKLQARLGAVSIGPFKEYLDEVRFGVKLINPYWYFLTMMKENPSIKFFSMPLHGDLHADNIQVESNGTPHLIDWGNAGTGHSALDYGMLETSIWAHCLPLDFLLTEICDVLEHIPLPGQADHTGHVVDIGDGDPLVRCSALVQRIRNRVCDFLDEPRDFQYALGLFVCSVQQLQYEDANLRSMLVLGDSAARILDEVWGFLPPANQ